MDWPAFYLGIRAPLTGRKNDWSARFAGETGVRFSRGTWYLEYAESEPFACHGAKAPRSCSVMSWH